MSEAELNNLLIEYKEVIEKLTSLFKRFEELREILSKEMEKENE